MPITEHTINDALAAVLRHGRQAWREAGIVHSETTGMLQGGNKRPDILVLEPFASPVVIETEIFPAATVEPEARSRLGANVASTGRTILSSIAVKLPKRLRSLDTSALSKELASATDFEIALFTGGSPDSFSRWPHQAWITGGLADLSILTQAASVPPEIIDRAADELTLGIYAAAGLIAESKHLNPAALSRISENLRQEPGEQTWRMAAAILANAFVFHESLARGPDKLSEVCNLEELKSKSQLNKSEILNQWNKILDVNYWSIFDIARRIMENIPGSVSNSVVKSLHDTASRLLEHRLMRSHDLTGAVFQRLIADRKFLAAYYTTPPSAALLAGLAIRSDCSPAGKTWADSSALQNMRIADFACGTGTLLSAAYQRISQLHELSGGDARTLHKYMMGGSLVGCDVLPAAAHLTASTLSSVHPTVTYAESSIITLSYGRLPDGRVSLGSWDLLDPQGTFEILAITAKAAQGTGEITTEPWSSLPHEGFDLVIMNPPFTRPTGHESDKIGIRNPMFAAFSSDNETQKLMAKKAVKLAAGTNYHGNAGEASIFLALAHRKLRNGGTIAMVLPLSFMLGESWEMSRALIKDCYGDLVFVTNAGAGGSDVSFSSDTDMGECLLIGRKGVGPSSRATFVTLNERPDTTMSGSGIAVSILQNIKGNNTRKLEDGPVGGAPILLGSELVGQAINAPIEEGFNLARIRDISLAQTAFFLINGRILLPTMKIGSEYSVPITALRNIAEIGPYHADINGRTANGGIRGPFDKQELLPGGTPTYPVLWEHVAERERTISFEADAECMPRVGHNLAEQEIIDRKIDAVWSSASHCHFNRDFRFNSQSTSMQYTQRKTIGGRAWTSVRAEDLRWEKVLVLWANSTLGMLTHWWFANKQQPGRGSIGKTALANLRVIDVSILSGHQLSVADQVFEKFKDVCLLPLHRIDSDTSRWDLDSAIMSDILGLPKALQEVDGPMDVLRQKLAREPSVLGHKGKA